MRPSLGSVPGLIGCSVGWIAVPAGDAGSFRFRVALWWGLERVVWWVVSWGRLWALLSGYRRHVWCSEVYPVKQFFVGLWGVIFSAVKMMSSPVSIGWGDPVVGESSADAGATEGASMF